MTLLDRFRRRPDWENDDPHVRAEAVRRLTRHERDLLVSIAKHDDAPRVRRAAVHKLDEPQVLTEVAQSDADPAVRAEALDGLLRLACQGEDEKAALIALQALTEGRHLITVARDARLETTRRTALERVADERSRATLAKTASDPAVRRAAVDSLQDPEILRDVAMKSEHKDAAVAALERLDDAEALAEVAEHGRNKAAARRAKTRLQEIAPSEHTPSGIAETPPPAPVEAATVTVDAPVAEETAKHEAAAPVPERPRVTPGGEAASSPEQPPAEDTPTAEPPEAVVAPPAETSAPAPAAPSVTVAGVQPIPDDPASSAVPDVAPEQAPDAETHDPEARAAAERAARENLARLEALAARVEVLAAAEQVDLRDAEHAMREIREALSQPGPVPSKRDRDTSLERLRAARSALFPRAQELREADEWTRWANVAIQEELCARVEALRDNDDLDAVARELRDVDARWKEARHVPKDEAGALWERFSVARQPLRERVGAHYAHQAAERKANLERKVALCVRAEALTQSTDWVATAKELQTLQAEWKTIGPVPRKQSDAVWKRFRQACQAFFERRKGDLDGRKKSWAENLTRKEALCEKAEALSASTDWETAASTLKSLQAEWKSVGPVRRSRSEAIWKRFRAACDTFFDRYKNRESLERAAAVEAREALVAEIEALAAESPDDLAARVEAIQARWRQAPAVGGDAGRALEQRLREARDALVRAHPERFQGTELDPAASRNRRRRLVSRVEELLPAPDAATDLAGRLKEALAANTLGGAAAAESRRRAAVSEIESARRAWSRLAPIVDEEDRELATRFESACRRVLER